MKNVTSWDYLLLLGQLIIFAICYFVILVQRISHVHIRISFKRKHLKLSFKHAPESIFTILLLSVIILSLAFSCIYVPNSKFYTAVGIQKIGEELYNMDFSDKPILISNCAIYLRLYFPTATIITLPFEEDDFDKFLKALPSKTLIILCKDPNYAWYEYGNRYIFKYLRNNVEFPSFLNKKHESKYLVIYEVNGDIPPFKLRISENEYRVHSVESHFKNSNVIRLTLNLLAQKSGKIYLLVNTVRFSEIFEIHLKDGENTFYNDFPYVMGNRYYGRYMLSPSVLIYNEDGELLYNARINEPHLKDEQIFLLLLIFLILLSSTLFLIRNSDEFLM